MAMKKVVVIEPPYARDTQVFAGDPRKEDMWNSGEWMDVKQPSLYLGTGTGETEREIKNEFSKALGVSAEIIKLYDI